MKKSDTQSHTEWLVCWMVTASFTYSIPWVHQFARLRCLICHYGQPRLKKKYFAQTTGVQCTPGVKTTLNVRCLRSKVILLTTLNADSMNLSNMWLHSMERIMCDQTFIMQDKFLRGMSKIGWACFPICEGNAVRWPWCSPNHTHNI